MPNFKRACALIMLCVVIFNTAGYYALFIVAQRQLAAHVLQRIETNSDELGGNLIFAIPLEVPYAPESQEYTEIDGEIMFHGEVYRTVRQKIHHNMLYVICVKDENSSESRKIMADYSRLFSGQEAQHANSTVRIINTLSKYYTVTDQPFKPTDRSSFGYLNFRPFTNLYTHIGCNLIFHPPKFC